MPDRQRHSRLSDVSGPSQDSPAQAGAQNPSAGPDGPDGPTGPAGSDSTDIPPGPIWPGDPRADTMMLDLSALRGTASETESASESAPTPRPTPTPTPTPAPGRPEPDRPAWELAVMQGREAALSDPMADTTLLRPVTLPLPTTEPVAADVAFEMADAYADADLDAGPDADPDADPDTHPEAVRSRSGRSPLVQRVLGRRRRLAVSLAGVAALAALLALPPVRAELRDSFTRKPQPYTALYFTSRPQVDGTVLTVPVSVHAVDTGTDAYSVHVWTVDAKGQVDDSHLADLAWDGQAMSTVVSMPVNPAAEFVWVALVGTDQILHYKIAVA